MYPYKRSTTEQDTEQRAYNRRERRAMLILCVITPAMFILTFLTW